MRDRIKWKYRHQLPEISACYFVWHTGVIIYIGKAKNLNRRFDCNHHRARYFRGCQIAFILVPERDLKAAERLFHLLYRPILNLACYPLGTRNRGFWHGYSRSGLRYRSYMQPISLALKTKIAENQKT